MPARAVVLLAEQGFKPRLFLEAVSQPSEGNESFLGAYVRTSVSASGRIHAGHIKSIEIKTNKKGKQVLLVMTKFDARFSQDEVDLEALDKVKALVAEVQRAMQSTTL